MNTKTPQYERYGILLRQDNPSLYGYVYDACHSCVPERTKLAASVLAGYFCGNSRAPSSPETAGELGESIFSSERPTGALIHSGDWILAFDGAHNDVGLYYRHADAGSAQHRLGQLTRRFRQRFCAPSASANSSCGVNADRINAPMVFSTNNELQELREHLVEARASGDQQRKRGDAFLDLLLKQREESANLRAELVRLKKHLANDGADSDARLKTASDEIARLRAICGVWENFGRSYKQARAQLNEI